MPLNISAEGYLSILNTCWQQRIAFYILSGPPGCMLAPMVSMRMHQPLQWRWLNKVVVSMALQDQINWWEITDWGWMGQMATIYHQNNAQVDECRNDTLTLTWEVMAMGNSDDICFWSWIQARLVTGYKAVTSLSRKIKLRKYMVFCCIFVYKSRSLQFAI